MDQHLITADPNFGTSYALPMHNTAAVGVSSILVNDTSQWLKPTVIGTDIIHLSYLLPYLLHIIITYYMLCYLLPPLKMSSSQMVLRPT